MLINICLLILLHIIGDFYLQSDKLSKCKQAQFDNACEPCSECNNKEYFNLKKVIIHSLLSLIPYVLLFFLWVTDFWKTILFLVIVFVSHIIIDCFSCWFKRQVKCSLAFIIDQFLHCLVLVL